MELSLSLLEMMGCLLNREVRYSIDFAIIDFLGSVTKTSERSSLFRLNI